MTDHSQIEGGQATAGHSAPAAHVRRVPVAARQGFAIWHCAPHYCLALAAIWLADTPASSVTFNFFYNYEDDAATYIMEDSQGTVIIGLYEAAAILPSRASRSATREMLIPRVPLSANTTPFPPRFTS